MTDITIKEFSKTVGLSVNRLIDQLELAGVKKKKESDLISDEEKMQLLNYVRNSQIKNKATKSKTVEKVDLSEDSKKKTIIRKKRVFSKVNNKVTEKIETKLPEKEDKEINDIEQEAQNIQENVGANENQIQKNDLIQENVNLNEDTGKKRRKKTKTKFVNEEKNNPSIKTKHRRQKIHISDDNKVVRKKPQKKAKDNTCLLYTSPSPRDRTRSRMPSSA